MAYVGRGVDKISNIEVLDAITFTDSAGPYNITKSAVAFVPTSPNALVISIDGVIQSPSSYTLSVATITFDSSMASTSTMDFMYQIGTGVMTAPSDGSVTTAKIGDLAVTAAKLATDAVETAKIKDDAVETAKIKDLNVTAGKLATTLDISSNTVTLPASVGGLGTGITNAQLAGSIDVTSKITGVVPTANLGSGTASSSTVLYGDQTYKAEPGGGSWNLLLTDTVSAEAVVEFDSTYINSTYKVYKIIISELVPANVGPGTEMYCRFKQGGSYITSGYGFSSFHHVDSSTTSFSGAASGSATAYQITSDNLGGDTGENSSWEFTLDNPAGTANKKIMWGSGGNVNHDNSYSRESTIGGSFNVGALTAIKFFMESDANFTSGRFSLYGITT